MEDNTNNIPEPEEDYDPFDEFLGGLEDEGNVFDPTQVVTVRTTSGGSTEVPMDGPATISDVFDKAGLAVGRNVEYWVNGQQVEASFEVAPGAVVTAVGMVKGGIG